MWKKVRQIKVYTGLHDKHIFGTLIFKKKNFSSFFIISISAANDGLKRTENMRRIYVKANKSILFVTFLIWTFTILHESWKLTKKKQKQTVCYILLRREIPTLTGKSHIKNGHIRMKHSKKKT